MVPDGKFSRQRLHLVALPPFIKAICETGFVVFSQRVTSLTQIMWHPQLAKGHLLVIVMHSITTSCCTITVSVGVLIRLTYQRLEFGYGSDCLSQTSIGNELGSGHVAGPTCQIDELDADNGNNKLNRGKPRHGAGILPSCGRLACKLWLSHTSIT